MSDETNIQVQMEERIAALEQQVEVWKKIAHDLYNDGVEFVDRMEKIIGPTASDAPAGTSECSSGECSSAPPSPANTSDVAQA